MEKRLEQMAVVGAGGKMGRGIALITLQLAWELRREGRASHVFLMDASIRALEELKTYLRKQLEKWAEKKASLIEGWGKDPQRYCEEVLEGATFCDHLKNLEGVRLVFEAAIEDREVKKAIFNQLVEACAPDAFFLTNTSSLPIGVLEQDAGIEGRLIGFHFYNPPPVQRLVEVISSSQTVKELEELALWLGKKMGKTLVPSADMAGFIGNGHFMRDLLYGCAWVERLQETLSGEEAVYAVQEVSHKWLMRPMGIFQLADYVGVDVCRQILRVMAEHIPHESFESERIEAYLLQGAVGGQNTDGSQKQGIFQYEKGAIQGVYSLEKKSYTTVEEVKGRVQEYLGVLPPSWPSWKELVKSKEKSQQLEQCWSQLWEQEGRGGEMAREFLIQSREIGEKLLDQGVASNPSHVNTVLECGFYHLHGPVTERFPETSSIKVKAD